jgi:tetratricopeptide (TPR) repeat protein
MNNNNAPEDICQRAKTLYEARQYVQAASAFEQAAVGYQANGDNLNAAEMYNNSSVAWLKAGNPQAAYERAAQTDQIFQSANNPRGEAIALGNQAAALEALGRKTEACDYYQRCAEVFRTIGEKELLSFVLKSLSALQMHMGDQFGSMASMYEALDVQKKLTLKERFLKNLLKLPARLMR